VRRIFQKNRCFLLPGGTKGDKLCHSREIRKRQPAVFQAHKRQKTVEAVPGNGCLSNREGFINWSRNFVKKECPAIMNVSAFFVCGEGVLMFPYPPPPHRIISTQVYPPVRIIREGQPRR
jgi:hypothetical protein